MTLCKVPGCGRRPEGRTLCKRHGQARRRGHVLRAGPRPSTPMETRFWLAVDKNGPVSVSPVAPGRCWTWTRNVNDEGYGHLARPDRTKELAHRYSYMINVGPIRPGRDTNIDHLCRNRRCVNPTHLEQVTRKENILRGVSPVAEN